MVFLQLPSAYALSRLSFAKDSVHHFYGVKGKLTVHLCWHLPPVFWVVRGVALDSLVGNLAVHLCWHLPPVVWVVRGVALDRPVLSFLKSPPLLHFPVLLL